MTKVHVVMTTVNPPGETVRAFVKRKDATLIVVADRKTPQNWKHPKVTYLSTKAQESSRFELASLLPWNHYSRKMLGYLEAILDEATLIFDIDDDNFPNRTFSVPELTGKFSTTESDMGFVNVFRCFTTQHVWPRGFPLKKINDSRAQISKKNLHTSVGNIGVWQGLSDECPDLDAIYHLVWDKKCRFAKRSPVVLAPGSICPINSQNTFFRREAFPLLYLPMTVTFRFTDILRGLVAQPILWAAGFRVGFHSATVVQKRNPHDYLEDFKSELPCYVSSHEIVDKVSSVVRSEIGISENLTRAYEALHKSGFVKSDELRALKAWQKDLKQALDA